ncbi:YqgU-like beta propeller domain-containing protein [Rossellomorea yichunensis]|uniref:YqgU-like beta propeller domain-containing protein n=1 Tax=Rossellomorea yichunensis TaxID=3077331 RepID=UPI0028DDAC10|nr:hypothetical protein [Rossellomorea sp. YC4-1]MDT9024858.1 hypothetical protein [Rossellomorea sp. YC4-1]
MNKKKVSVLLLLLLSILWLSACQTEQTQTSPPEKEKSENKEVVSGILSQDSFVENIGWLSDSEILSVQNNDDLSSLYIYNLYDGSTKKIYDIPSSFVSASISPDKNKILIHSAPASYSARVTIIDRAGEVLFQEDIPSYELTHSWNKFDDNALLMTSFSEDWSFKVFHIDVEEGTMDPIEVEQPFVQWQSKYSILFQDWNTEEISVAAPLISQNIQGGGEEMIVDTSIHFNQFNNSLLSISSREEEGPFAYQFITSNGEIQSEFTVDLLSRYSDWLIPHYDMIEGKGQLITFVANEPGSFDTYSGTFSLEKWDTVSGKDSILFEDLPLEPIQCSPNGNYCLYGNQLEKVIDLANSTIIQLLKEGADL